MILDQKKLDVKSKSRSNLFNWRGQFTPEFVEYLLTHFSQKGQHVLDPFSGSGTVLQESTRLGLKATGLEINPSAFAMSSFFELCNFNIDERQEFLNQISFKLNAELPNLNGQKIYKEGETYKESYSNLLEFTDRVLPLFQNNYQKNCLLNILFRSEKDKNLSVKESIIKSFNYVSDCLLNLPYSDQKITAHLADARSSGILVKDHIDLIITSPPYINVFNYHQNYRAIVESLNYNILEVANSEFGANRKNRGNRFKTVIQYCIDMELAIRSFWYALRDNGKIIMVLGRESNVRGIAFLNSQLVLEIIEKCNGFSNIQVLERSFINKFGMNIKEDIIIAKKGNTSLSTTDHGRSIALKHLEGGLTKASNEIYDDILDAIKNIEQITESPLFALKN